MRQVLCKDSIQAFGLPSTLFFAKVFVLQFFFLFLPVHLQQLGLLNWQIGVLGGLFQVTALFLTVPFGFFSDRIVPKHLVSVGFFLFACFVFGLGRVTDFLGLLLLFLLGGAAYNMIYISLASLYYKTLGSENKSKKIALMEISRVLGYGLGPFAAGFLVASMGFSGLFSIAFAAVLPLFLLSFLLKKTRGISFSLSDYKRDLSNRTFQLVFIGYFFLALHFGAEQTMHALFLRNVVGLQFEQMSWVFLWIAGVIVAFTALGGWLLDRTKRFVAVMMLGLVASAMGNILYLWTFSFVAVLLNRFIHEFGDAFAMLSVKAIVPELTQVKRVGGVFGTLMLGSYSGTVAGALLSGIVADVFGYAMPFAVTGAALFATLIIFGLLFFRKKREVVE